MYALGYHSLVSNKREGKMATRIITEQQLKEEFPNVFKILWDGKHTLKRPKREDYGTGYDYAQAVSKYMKQSMAGKE